MFVVGLVTGALFVLPCVVIYALFIKGIDRYEPEPWWLLISAFIWGAIVSTTIAAIASIIGQVAFSIAAGAHPSDPLVDAMTATVIAPITEESTKGLGLLILWLVSWWRLKELDGPLDGAIYGGVIGLGFTLTEDVMYVAGAMAQAGPQGFAALFVLRTILAGLAHASFTALMGLGIGLAVEARHPAVKILAPIIGWVGAVMLHALHNGLVTFLFAGGAGLVLKIVLFWLIDCLYFVLLIALVFRDRHIVIEGLKDEVGRIIHELELRRTSSLWMFVPLWNYVSLADSPGGYRAARGKQLSLIELAFLKRRRGRGEVGLDSIEQRLRGRIDQANHRGVMVGRR